MLAFFLQALARLGGHDVFVLLSQIENWNKCRHVGTTRAQSSPDNSNGVKENIGCGEDVDEDNNDNEMEQRSKTPRPLVNVKENNWTTE